MTAPPDLEGVLAALRPLLAPYAAGFTAVRDTSGAFSPDTRHIISVYVLPQLLAPVGPALRKRMQSKSCFNFRRVDPALVQELSVLVAAGHARYVQAGYAAA